MAYPPLDINFIYRDLATASPDKEPIEIPTSWFRVMRLEDGGDPTAIPDVELFWTSGQTIGERLIPEKAFCRPSGGPIGQVYLKWSAQAACILVLQYSNDLRVGF